MLPSTARYLEQEYNCNRPKLCQSRLPMRLLGTSSYLAARDNSVLNLVSSLILRVVHCWIFKTELFVDSSQWASHNDTTTVDGAIVEHSYARVRNYQRSVVLSQIPVPQSPILCRQDMHVQLKIWQIETLTTYGEHLLVSDGWPWVELWYWRWCQWPQSWGGRAQEAWTRRRCSETFRRINSSLS